MGHGIDSDDNMFSVKERPWHKLGIVLENAPSIKEAIKLAGLDWSVGLEPLFTKDKTRVDAWATYRMSDKKKHILGIVGKEYCPLQNIEAFDWFNPFVEENLVELETAGSLFSGKKVWILARICGENLTIRDGDEIERFILLSNSHDGTTAVRVGYTPVRVVCNNTLTLAHEHEVSKLIRVRHNYRVYNNINALRETMDLVNRQFITTVESYKILAQKGINSQDLAKYVKQVFSTKKLEEMLKSEKQNENLPVRPKIFEKVEELLESGRGSGISKKTMWDAYNAVQEYLQYEKGTIKTTDEMRYNSLWFGDSNLLNKRALKVALGSGK